MGSTGAKMGRNYARRRGQGYPQIFSHAHSYFLDRHYPQMKYADYREYR